MNGRAYLVCVLLVILGTYALVGLAILLVP